MGAGKTTLGKLVAEQLDYSFLDLDDLIEEREGRSVQEIFAQEGQQLFREKEHAALQATGDLHGQYLIACGGGTPCFHNNMSLINRLGTSVYLQTNPAELARRLIPYKSHRPLISHIPDLELASFISSLLSQREEFYLQARLILTSDNPSPDDLIALLR